MSRIPSTILKRMAQIKAGPPIDAPQPEGKDLRWAHAIVAKQANGQYVSPAALRDAHIALRGRQLA